MNAFAESRSRVIWWICIAGFAFVALNALRSLPQISALLLSADGDDQMRLAEVRDWLSGQGWFDSHQYRVLPPDGISMHWSRYIDAGIAAFLVPASWFLSPTGAEFAALILWPSLLAALMVLVISHGAGRLFGGAAAIGGLAVFFGWSKLGGEFVPPRIDHHNTQILFSTAVFYLSLVPGRPRLMGALAGACTAGALAIGLEMLPTLAVIWGLVGLRHAFGQRQAGDWLLGFGPAFLLLAPILLVGQTPPSEWLVLHCDELAPPVIVLGAIGVVATLVPVLAERVLRGALIRIVVMSAITAIGLWLAFPLLGPCLAGPYSNVAPEVRRIIEGNIVEALSVRTLWESYPRLLFQILMPPMLIGLLALGTAWRIRARLDAVQAIALVQSFAILAIGMVFACIQIRAANLATPAVPLLGGFLLYAFMQIPRNSLLRIPAVIVVLLAQPSLVEKAGQLVGRPSQTGDGTGNAVVASRMTLNCRTPEDLALIAALPKSIVFSTLNLGPAILAFTPQSITSAGYHRSMDAYWNGLGAFESRTALRDALIKSRAEYVVLCKGGAVEKTSPFILDILSGNLPIWLSDISDADVPVRVYRVEKEALMAAGDAP